MTRSSSRPARTRAASSCLPAKHDVTIRGSRPQHGRPRRREPAQERDRRPRRRRVDPQPLGARLHEERPLLGRRRPVPRVVRHGLERRRVRRLRRGRRARESRPRVRLGRGAGGVLRRRVQAVRRHDLARRREVVRRRVLGDERHRRRDPRFRPGIATARGSSRTRMPTRRCRRRRGRTIVRNTVTNSGRARVPIKTALAGFIGIGIAIAGGNENSVAGNRVTGSERYGIAVFPTARYVVFDPGTPEPGPPWRPRGNTVWLNTVSGSGWRRSRACSRRRHAQLLHAQPCRALGAPRPADDRRAPARAPSATRRWRPSSHARSAR